MSVPKQNKKKERKKEETREKKGFNMKMMLTMTLFDCFNVRSL